MTSLLEKNQQGSNQCTTFLWSDHCLYLCILFTMFQALYHIMYKQDNGQPLMLVVTRRLIQFVLDI